MTTFDPNAAAGADSGIFGLDADAAQAAVWVHGAPFDATASYRKGAWQGPQAILQASRQVDLYDAWTARPYEAGIYMAPLDRRILRWNKEASPLADLVIETGGDVRGKPRLARALERVNARSGDVNQLVREQTLSALDAGKLPVLVGGDHSTPFGAIQACSERCGPLGVLHVDAHADLRPAYEGFEWSHASIMENVVRRLPRVQRLVQVGIRDYCEQELETIRGSNGRIRTLFDKEWSEARARGEDLRRLLRALMARLPERVYVSVDVDGLDPVLCPQTGTPVPGGLTWGEMQLLLAELARSGKRVVGLDVNEVNPGATWKPGHPDAWDAIVGARLLYRLIATALATRQATRRTARGPGPRPRRSRS